MKSRFLIIIQISVLLIFVFSCKRIVTDAGESESQYPDDSIVAKADSVIGLMTLTEKIGQLTLFTSDIDVTGPSIRANYMEDIRTGRLGAIFNAYGAEYTRKLQAIAVNETRLGIPLLFGYDVIHGFRTIFPIPLGESSTWDLEYIRKASEISAIEATSEGLHWTFAPMVDVARDPRWGRIAEGSGEDTYLNSLIGAAKVKGFQGEKLSDLHTLLACVKHYAAYGAAQAGRDYHTVDISEITLRDVYLPPFKAAVDAGSATIMTAFNEVFGVPCTANKFLLTDILRNEWNFNGFVVTDYTSINEMVAHGYARDDKHAAELAINAGADMDMQGATFYNHLEKLVGEDSVSMSRIDEAVRRILILKFELGLFDDPYRYSDTVREKEMVMTQEHLEFAREYARRSFVLLKNENNALPLDKNIKTLAIIGPLADNQKELLGSWTAAGDYNQVVSVMDGISQKLAGSRTRILYTEGCGISDSSKNGFGEALKIARSSDAVILVAGEQGLMSGEAASRADISLPGVQEELAIELAGTGKPLIVVLMNGRPLTIEKLHDNASAILETWFAGTVAGDAIADVLFGDYNPSGKLTVTFPRNVGQIPLYYNMKNTGRPLSDNKYTSKYLDVPNTPLYPFGYGLSYTNFSYSEISFDKERINFTDTLKATVIITNTGKMAGKEIVQLYIRDLVGSITRPVKELKGFSKIKLEPGESKKVTFSVTSSDLAFFNGRNEFKAEPGMFHLFIGTDSENLKMMKFEMVD